MSRNRYAAAESLLDVNAPSMTNEALVAIFRFGLTSTMRNRAAAELATREYKEVPVTASKSTSKASAAKVAPIADYFRAGGAALRAASAAGDEAATAELARRKAKHAEAASE